ncbi:arginase family protein [Asanoa sp. NPDC050611]|uniref:arginase family protein n=1 Tax=Asanoa sp. NPDC050611 TaxID=3157098 RepID=UPI0033DD8F56
MTIIGVPYHQDERLADDHVPLPAGAARVDPVLPAGAVWERLTALHGAVAERVATAIRAGDVPTVVSGDCLVALGTLAGVQRAGIDPGLVWFDAHGDVHTLDTTTSGYLGGLALRLASGAHDDLVAGPLGLRPVPVERTVLVGARDLDPAEVAYLDSGAGPALRAVDDLGELPDGPLVLHVDLDVIDAGDLPGLLFPAPGGPSTSDVRAAMGRILATGRVVALDIACPWHPAPSAGAQAARTELLASLAS